MEIILLIVVILGMIDWLIAKRQIHKRIIDIEKRLDEIGLYEKK